MTNRERNIAITVGAVIGLAGLNAIVEGQLATRTELDGKIQEAQRGLIDDNRLISRKDGNKNKLTNLMNTSLMRNQSDADAQLFVRHLECLMQASIDPVQAGYNAGAPSLVKIGNKTPPKDAPQFMKQNARVTLKNSNMSQVSRYAFLINSSNIPVRITDLQMTPTKENTDDFNVEFTLSTVFLTQLQDGARGQAGGAGTPATRSAASTTTGTNAAQNQNQNRNTAPTSGPGRGARGALGTPTTTRTEARP